MEDTKEYEVLVECEIGGETRAVGDKVSLTEDEATQLVEDGKIKAVEEESEEE